MRICAADPGDAWGLLRGESRWLGADLGPQRLGRGLLRPKAAEGPTSFCASESMWSLCGSGNFPGSASESKGSLRNLKEAVSGTLPKGSQGTVKEPWGASVLHLGKRVGFLHSPFAFPKVVAVETCQLQLGKSSDTHSHPKLNTTARAAACTSVGQAFVCKLA